MNSKHIYGTTQTRTWTATFMAEGTTFEVTKRIWNAKITLLLLLGIVSLLPTVSGAEEPKMKLPETIKKRPKDFVNLQHEIPHIRWLPIYEKNENITGKALYPKNSQPYACKHLSSALKKATKEFEALGYGILLYDAYRPHRVTCLLWNASRAKKLPANTYACPFETSDHNRGAAIDMGLYRLDTKKPIAMPCPVDEEQKGLPSPEAKVNAIMLKKIMIQAGFSPHSKEWWHFSYLPSKINPPGDWTP